MTQFPLVPVPLRKSGSVAESVIVRRFGKGFGPESLEVIPIAELNDRYRHGGGELGGDIEKVRFVGSSHSGSWARANLKWLADEERYIVTEVLVGPRPGDPVAKLAD